MQTPEGIIVLPTSYQAVLSLLKSTALGAVEEAIATRCGLRIIPGDGTASITYTQADISVSGLTTTQLEDYLTTNRNSLISFGARFLCDDDATSDDQEYPEGEEQEPDGESQERGHEVGFAIKIAIYHNFLANRTPAEFRVFLKNRRIPKHTKFAKELARIFDEVETQEP